MPLPTDPVGKYSSTEAPNWHSDYAITVRYIYESGKIQLPLGNPAGDTVVVTIQSKVCKKVVDWVAKRVGAKPTLPASSNGDTNLVLLSSEILAENTTYGGEAVFPIYSVVGRYTYAMKSAFIPDTTALRTAVSPVYTDTISGQDIESGQYNTGLF